MLLNNGIISSKTGDFYCILLQMMSNIGLKSSIPHRRHLGVVTEWHGTICGKVTSLGQHDWHANYILWTEEDGEGCLLPTDKENKLCTRLTACGHGDVNISLLLAIGTRL